MEILLFLLILLQLLLAMITLRTLIHPIIILKAYCALSALVLIFYSEVWGLYLSMGTVLIFSTGLIWVDVGFLLMSLTINKEKKKKLSKESFSKDNQFLKKKISINSTIIIIFFMLISLAAFYNNGKAYISLNNGIEDLSRSIIELKAARKNGEVSDLGIWQYALTICTVLGISYTYVCIKEGIENGFNKKFFLFSLPIVITFFIFYMTGRRSFLLHLIIISLVLVYEYGLRKYEKIPVKIQLKFLSWTILLLICFYFFFVTAGTLFLKGQNLGMSSFSSFAIYLSGGIVAFDTVYKNFTLTSEIFGQNIFRIFYKIMNIFPGVNFPTEDTIKKSIYVGNNFVTNVFTVNLPYMADFGYIGVIVGNVMIGSFYAFLYFKSKNEKKIGFWNVLYAFFLTRLLSYTGSESFFLPMTLNLQYIFVLILLFKTSFLFKKKKAEKITNSTLSLY